MAPVATKRRPTAKGRPVARGRPVRPGVPDEKVANKVAVATAPALARLLSLPRFLIPIAAVVTLFVGLALGGLAGLILLWGLAAVLGWFLIAFWPMTTNGGRVLRTLVVLGVLAAGLINLD